MTVDRNTSEVVKQIYISALITILSKVTATQEHNHNAILSALVWHLFSFW